MFPPEYRNNMFVAFHGSWNRRVPTGYKIVRVKRAVAPAVRSMNAGHVAEA
jgi:glucose/arabinose dehydrogenase